MKITRKKLQKVIEEETQLLLKEYTAVPGTNPVSTAIDASKAALELTPQELIYRKIKEITSTHKEIDRIAGSRDMAVSNEEYQLIDQLGTILNQLLRSLDPKSITK